MRKISREEIRRTLKSGFSLKFGKFTNKQYIQIQNDGYHSLLLGFLLDARKCSGTAFGAGKKHNRHYRAASQLTPTPSG